VANNNGFDGISSATWGTLLDNQCAGNGGSSSAGAGIRITGQGCRVEGNTLQGNDTGILVQPGATRCVVVRNVLFDNAVDLTTAADNAVGEVVNLSGGGTVTETTSAWANIRY
jgi:parallel beta-helix repeat protein